VLEGSGRFGREVGVEVQDGSVAPYAGVHLTRWCAAVRRGQHTKSVGYSGHVVGTGS